MTVIVANASNVNGSAAEMSCALGVVGYATGEPTNKAASVGQLDTTVVYFDPAVPNAEKSRAPSPGRWAGSIDRRGRRAGADRVGRDSAVPGCS